MKAPSRCQSPLAMIVRAAAMTRFGRAHGLGEIRSVADRDQRTGNAGMLAPRVLELPAGTFHAWTREHGRPGDPMEVQRVSNDRRVAESLLSFMKARGRELVAVSS